MAVPPTQREDALDAPKISSSKAHCLRTMVSGATTTYLVISQRYMDACFVVATRATDGPLLVILMGMTARSRCHPTYFNEPQTQTLILKLACPSE